MKVDAEGKKGYARMLVKILLYQEKFFLQEKKGTDMIHREYVAMHCDLDLIKEGREN